MVASAAKLPALRVAPLPICSGRAIATVGAWTRCLDDAVDSPSHLGAKWSPARKPPSTPSTPVLPVVTCASEWSPSACSTSSASPNDAGSPKAASASKEPRTSSKSRVRPWRKSKLECDAERSEARRLLGCQDDPADIAAGAAAGVDVNALLFCVVAQELLEGACHRGLASSDACAGEALERDGALSPEQAAWAAVDLLRQSATNDMPAADIEAARSRACEALGVVGLLDALETRLRQPNVCRKDAIQQVMPGLWLGGWAALDKGGEELRRRCITHVVSVLSTDLPPQRQVPDFVRGHLHVHADDREGAAQELGERFAEICLFVDNARSETDSRVLVHCGAGISRAPTVVAAYVMWKLGLSGARALQMVERVRPTVRPNLGFVRELRRWEVHLRSLLPPGSALPWVPPPLPAPAPVSSLARERRFSKSCPSIKVGYLGNKAPVGGASNTAPARRLPRKGAETPGSPISIGESKGRCVTGGVARAQTASRAKLNVSHARPRPCT